MDDQDTNLKSVAVAGVDADRTVLGWTFLSNHAHVLLCIARDPVIRLRDIASAVGITERAAQRIVSDLADAGYLTRERMGRRNRYAIHLDLPLRHPLEADSPVGVLLEPLLPK